MTNQWLCRYWDHAWLLIPASAPALHTSAHQAPGATFYSMRPVASNCSSGSRAWLPPSSEGVYERCGGSAGYGWDIIYWQSPSKMCSWKHWLQGYCAAKAVTKQKPAINIGGDTGEGSPFIQISGAGGAKPGVNFTNFAKMWAEAAASSAASRPTARFRDYLWVFWAWLRWHADIQP